MRTIRYVRPAPGICPWGRRCSNGYSAFGYVGSVRGSKLCKVSYEHLVISIVFARDAHTVDKTIDSENAVLKKVGAMLDYNQGRAMNECKDIRAGDQ